MSDNWFDKLRDLGKQMGQTAYIAGLKGEVLEMVAPGRARMRLPYGPDLVGDPDTGIVHGGVITGILDHTCGMCVTAALRTPMPIATLDLRIDYMKPAVPGQDIFAEAECVKVGHDVAFVRGLAHQGSREEPIALCTGAFMLIRGGYQMPPAAE
jgi:uncharacterized protein (TIGR00369 family)